MTQFKGKKNLLKLSKHCKCNFVPPFKTNFVYFPKYEKDPGIALKIVIRREGYRKYPKKKKIALNGGEG